jgi:hypothetical protein
MPMHWEPNRISSSFEQRVEGEATHSIPYGCVSCVSKHTYHYFYSYNGCLYPSLFNDNFLFFFLFLGGTTSTKGGGNGRLLFTGMRHSIYAPWHVCFSLFLNLCSCT